MSVSAEQRASLERAVKHYEQQIGAAGDYLWSRGIPEHVAVTRRLGAVVEPLVGHEQYVGRLAIPYLTPAGVVDIRFRTIGAAQHGDKYLSRPGSTLHVYGVLSLQTHSPILGICEGELDALVLDELVGIPAIGIPGAQAWRDHYWRLVEDYERVMVFADGDQPGRDFAKRVAATVEGAVVVGMPDDQDVNSVYLSEGADGLRRRAGL